MSILELVDSGELIGVRPLTSGFKIPWGEQEPHVPVRVKCARCPGWTGAATTVGEMRTVYAAHREMVHGERS